MNPQNSTELDGLLAVAASAATATVASSEPLSAGAVTRDVDSLGAGTNAVLASFAGPRSGELVIVVDDELTLALESAPDGPIDLAKALLPALQSIATALGPAVLGPAQVTDARLALSRILAADDAGIVPLVGASGPRAAVALSLNPQPADTRAVAASSESELAGVPVDRLDMLRGVEMEATAELGRTKMTVNDLLALRSGAVIELDRVAGGPADLLVNGRLIARGEVVVVDENYGIRITQVVTDSGR